MKWTADQQKAIDLRECNILVSAAAGSGKTAVVTRRAVKLIVEENVDIENILMITFTDAAAAEMKVRLGAKLLDEIQKHPEDKRLASQLDKLNDANISTIHTYCMSVIRLYYQEINIDPSFSILGGEDSIDYKIRAVNKVIEEYFEKKDKDFLTLCDSLGGRGGKDISDIAMKLYDFARSQPDYIGNINEWTNRYSMNADELKKSHWINYLLDDIANKINDTLVLNEYAAELAGLEGGPKSYIETFTADKIYLYSINDALSTREISALKNAVTSGRFVTLSRKSKDDDELLVNQCKSIREKIKSIIKGIKSSIIMLDIDELTARNNSMYPALSSLRNLVLDFNKEYSRLKRRSRQLDFDDLQHLTLEALNNEAIAKAETDRFTHIFVDEYQDTNQLQESLINKITGRNNLLCVGDVKQSIYAFRQADPELFYNRRNKYKVDNTKANELICLNQNFRSAPTIINTINLLFGEIMSTRLGGIEYDQDEMLYHGTPRPPKEQNEGVDFVIINYENDKDEANQMVEKEAKAAADYIKLLVGKPIWDGKLQKMRPAQYKDICILSKAFKPTARTIRSVLEQQGIPVIQNQSGKYFDEVEIGQLIDILTVIDNKRRDTALISAMMSPAFGFDIEELLQIRKETDKSQAFYKCILEYADINNALGDKINVFLQKLSKYKMLAKYMDLSSFIWQVLDETGLYNAVGALPGGAVRQSNLRLLLDRAANYSKQPMASLSGFLAYIKRLHLSDASIESDNLSSDNSVQFMSIHKSKGLEFPIVIIINANKQPSLMSQDKTITTYKHLGFGIKSYNTKERTKLNTIASEAISKAIADSVLSEDIRVFYVALTRARERLIVIGSMGKGKNIKDLANTWSEPFLPANYGKTNATLFNYMGIAAVRNLSCGNLISLADIHAENKNVIDNFSVDIIDAENIKVNRIRRVGAVAKAINECSAITSVPSFLWQYNDNKSIIPAKTSATKLLSASDLEKIDIPALSTIPSFDEPLSNITPAMRGTITHKFLQHIDWNNADTIKQTNKLIKRGILPENADKIINYKAVNEFLNSDIVARFKKANKIYREMPFVAKKKYNDLMLNSENNQEILVQGIIDLCFIEDNMWVIVDYKTTRITPNQTEKDILEHYRLQLTVYSQALESITNIKVKQAGIYLLTLSKMIWL